jgi:hypothetical protein
MRTALARAAIALVALMAIGCLVALPFFPAANVDFGLSYANSFEPSRAVVVESVAPNSVAAKAGIAVGDRLKLARDTPDERIRLRTLRSGEPIAFDVFRNGAGKRVVLSDSAPAYTPLEISLLEAFVFLTYGAMALLIVRRRSGDSRALELAGFLAAFALGGALSSLVLEHVRGPWWVACGVVAQSAYVMGGYFVTAFCSSFPHPAERGFRRWVGRANVPVAFVALILTVVGILGPYLDPKGGLSLLSITPFSLCWVFFIGGSLGSLGVSLARARGLERQQLLWIALTFGFGFSGLAVVFASLAIAHRFGDVRYGTLTVALIPIGLAYVILRHRVVDVGFALNRAAVFGVVSLVVVALVGSIEWLVEKYVLAYGHIASSAVQLAVALGIGFGMRPLHAAIDRFVDDLFFRKRHEREERLRRFARELPYFTNREIALGRTSEVIRQCADASSVAVFQTTGRAFANAILDPGAVGLAKLDENDPAIVALKAWHEPFDLERSGSALGDGLAFGLQVRGELIGALALGPKRGGEAYAPDERDALESLAQALASLLDALEIAELRRRLAAQLPAVALG